MHNQPHKDHPDYKAGIRFYTPSVHNCPVCKRHANCAFQSQFGGRPTIACSAKCADAIVGQPIDMPS